MADLLSREGHPLATRVTAARETIRAAAKNPDAAASARRSIGLTAGAMLVFGSVVAGALGLNHSTPAPANTAAAGEPVGALPGKVAPGQPGKAPSGPAAAAPVSPQFTNTASTESLPQSATGPAGGQIGAPATLPPPPAKEATPPAQKQQQQPAPPPAQAPAQPAAPSGPVTALTQPVGQVVQGTTQTLGSVVAPVTNTVDNTLQPALSLIGGLLGGHHH